LNVRLPIQQLPVSGYQLPVTGNWQLATGNAHSVRNDFTGLAIAAFIAWKLTVIIVIKSAAQPASTNTCHLIDIL